MSECRWEEKLFCLEIVSTSISYIYIKELREDLGTKKDPVVIHVKEVKKVGVN